MSTMASARIPSELYDQGVARLQSIGSNTTELMVSAFSYLVATGELPSYQAPNAPRNKPTPEQLSDLREKLAKSSLRINLPANWDYKVELTRELEADYEALA